MNLSNYLNNNMLLAKKEQSFKKTQQKIIASNLNHIINVTTEYLHDLIQKDLVESIDKFKANTNKKFSACTTSMIKQSILKFLTETRSTIDYPIYINNNSNEINKFLNGYREIYSKNPSSKKIAESLDLNLKEVTRYINLIKGAHIYLEEWFGNEKIIKISEKFFRKR